MDDHDVLALLARIDAGDEAAFTALYRAHAPKLETYVLRQVNDPALTEEIVSDTLYDVWRAPGRFRGDASFGTWLIAIARNKMRMAWRARQRDVTHDHDDLDAVAETLASEADSAFDLLVRLQRNQALGRCLDQLPDEQRECVQLVFYEGLSLAEVAAAQRVPEGTVKTRLFHARRKLEESLPRLLHHEAPTLPAVAFAT